MWGGDKAPTASVDGTQGRLTGGGRSIAAMVFRFATLKKSSVSAGKNPYDFAEFIRKNAINIREPFSKYPFQFEYYASFVKTNKDRYQLELEDTECEDLDLLYYIDSDRSAGYSDHIVRMNATESEKFSVILHETGHYFKLQDEYVYNSYKPAKLMAEWIATGTNCDTDDTCMNIKAKAGIFYSDSCYKGCVSLSGYRTTINSLMNLDSPTALFNEVSCAVIVQKIEQMWDRNKAWEKCNQMTNLGKTEQCEYEFQCNTFSSPLPVTCIGECDFFSMDCGTCNDKTKTCEKSGDFYVQGGRSCDSKLLTLSADKVYRGKCEGLKPPYICNAIFR